MAVKKAAAKKAPVKKTPAKKASRWKPAQQRPAAESRRNRGSAATPHTLSVGKTQRLINARLCPGGNAIDAFGSRGDGCGRCPSVAQCHEARFNPKVV